MSRFTVTYQGRVADTDRTYPGQHHFFIPTWAKADVKAWCVDHATGVIDGWFCFFKRDEDAIAFRLRWCGARLDVGLRR